MPANQLTVPGQGEAVFALRHSDWKRLRSRVESLQRPMPGLSAAAWAVAGFGGSSVFGLITWLAADAQLSSTLRPDFAWITPVFVAAVFASVVVATVFFIANGQIKGHNQRSAKDVLAEMDDVYAPFKGLEDLTPTESSNRPAEAAQGAPGFIRRGGVRDNGDLVLGVNDVIDHDDFGRGTVASVSGSGSRSIATVDFQTAGRKRLLVKIAPIRLIARPGGHPGDARP